MILKKHPKKSILLLVLLIAYAFCLPNRLFKDPYSTVIESKEGYLLGAKVAMDGQWRFPTQDSIPYKFRQCIIQFEDAYFYQHIGFNPISIAKAMAQNLKRGKIVRGGSTLTQQVIRLARKGQKRTYLEKLYELILATRLEIRYSKDKILNLYASHAPYGGNVVGLEVASWRYFGVKPHQLSWAETATLAVLPNAPSLIYPGKNQQKLLQKRNRLLKKLYTEKIIDSMTYKLALDEKLPQKPYPLPQIAPHLLQRIAKKHQGKRIKTSVSLFQQKTVNRIVQKHYNHFKGNGIQNMAILVLDVNTKKVLAYVGNTPTSKEHQKYVDIIVAPRSTGSVLKPFLYMAMLDKGELLPNALVEDIPTSIKGYQPKNFNSKYTGATKASIALAKSLNIPAVRMLHHYGLKRFYDELRPFEFHSINKGADYYGLTFILGGAESTLWDLSSAYMNLAGVVKHNTNHQGKYYTHEFQKPSFLKDSKLDLGDLVYEKNIFDAGSIYLGFEAMREVNRPESDGAWKYYDSSQQIAWKTGTSYGNRDAWAIGVTQNIVVGVWVGNADGEGRPNLTGINNGAPVMFDVFSAFPKSKWFEKPLNELEEITVCSQSGYLATPICETKKELAPLVAERFKSCPFHHLVHLTKDEKYRVNTSCEDIENIHTKPWFTLPPLQEWYYKKSHANYKTLPNFRSDCKGKILNEMDFIFPNNHSKIILTKNENEEINPLICKIAHRNPHLKVYWYIDDTYIATTETFHQIAINPSIGKHLITAIDEKGNQVTSKITIDK